MSNDHLGLILAGTGTLAIVFGDFGKRQLAHRGHPLASIWGLMPLAALANGLYCYFAGLSLPPLSALPFILATLVIFYFCELFFILALKRGEYSQVIPLQALYPICAAVTSYLALGEEISPSGIFGIALTVVGTYLMFKDPNGPSPLRAILINSGARYMVLQKIFSAIMAVFLKVGGASFSPAAFFLPIFLGNWILISITLRVKGINPISELSHQLKTLLILGSIWAVGITLFWSAMAYTEIVHVTMISMLQPLLAVPMGAILLGEKNAMKRFGAAGIMVLGVVVFLLTS